MPGNRLETALANPPHQISGDNVSRTKKVDHSLSCDCLDDTDKRVLDVAHGVFLGLLRWTNVSTAF